MYVYIYYIYVHICVCICVRICICICMCMCMCMCMCICICICIYIYTYIYISAPIFHGNIPFKTVFPCLLTLLPLTAVAALGRFERPRLFWATASGRRTPHGWPGAERPVHQDLCSWNKDVKTPGDDGNNIYILIYINIYIMGYPLFIEMNMF